MRSSTNTSIHWTLLLVALMAILPTAGCQICCDPDALSYPTYGGAWERTRRDGGRVGSIFDPAGAKASTLVGRDEPETPEVQDRRRYKEDPNAFSLNPDNNDSEAEEVAPPSDAEKEESLKGRMERLRDEGLEDINIVPGEAAPPLLY